VHGKPVVDPDGVSSASALEWLRPGEEEVFTAAQLRADHDLQVRQHSVIEIELVAVILQNAHVVSQKTAGARLRTTQDTVRWRELSQRAAGRTLAVLAVPGSRRERRGFLVIVNRLTVDGKDYFLPEPVIELRAKILAAIQAGGGYVNIPPLRTGPGIDILFSPGMPVSWTQLDVGGDSSGEEASTEKSVDHEQIELGVDLDEVL
jgi:hypothetical protein